MSTYTVHEPPAAKASLDERAESLVFVPDGFSWGAFTFGPIYFLVKREWAGLLALVAAALLMRGVLALFDAGAVALMVGSIVLAIVAGFEANEIRRASLSYFGWREIAVVSGRTIEDCEHRFFTSWLPSEPVVTPDAWRSSPFADEGRLDALSRGLHTTQRAVAGGFTRVRRKLTSKP